MTKVAFLEQSHYKKKSMDILHVVFQSFIVSFLWLFAGLLILGGVVYWRRKKRNNKNTSS